MIGLQRCTGKDRYGKSTFADPIDVRTDAIYPRGSREGDTVFTGLTAILPPGQPAPTSDDRVIYDGLVYDVVGEVAPWHYFGDQHAGTQVNLERVT